MTRCALKFADPVMKCLNIDRGVAPAAAQDSAPQDADHDQSQPLLNHEQPQTPGFGRTPPDRDKINP